MAVKFFARHRWLAMSVCVAALAGAPATAQAGFFDQLFGVAPTPAPAPAPAPSVQYGVPAGSVAPAPRASGRAEHHADSHRARKRMVARETKPVRQEPTDLMHDKTLRPGDAVMMKNGVHVYAGPETSRHHESQFLPLDNARHLSSQERGELVAMDMTRRDPLEYVSSKNTVREGRSSVDGPMIAAGYKITDARGRSIRYVGP